MPQPISNVVQQKGLVPVSPFASFGNQPVGTNQSSPKSLAAGISDAFGRLSGNQSTVPFAGGGATAPTSVGSFAASNPPTPVLPPGMPPAPTTSVFQASSAPDTQSQYGSANGLMPTPIAQSPTSGLVPPPQQYGPGGTATNNAQSGGLIAPPQPQQPSQSTVAGLIPGILGAASSNPDVSAARDKIQELRNRQATELQQIGSTPGLGLSEASGQEGLVNQLYVSREAAAQEALATAQGQQQTQVGAYGAALGAAAPITGVPYGTQTLQPGLIGVPGSQQASGATVSPSDPFYATMQTYANALANNQGSAIPSSVTGNPALQAQLLQMARAINPSFNYNEAQGAGAAQASNAATGGTASVTANQGVYNTAMGNLANYQNMAANIRSFGDQAIQNISSLPLTSSQLANTTIQKAMTQFNSPQFAQFNANIQGLQARVSALLGTGEIPTSATAGAQAIINGTLNLGSLKSTLDQINSEADAIVGNQADIATNAYSNITSGPQSNGTSNPNTPNPWH